MLQSYDLTNEIIIDYYLQYATYSEQVEMLKALKDIYLNK